MEENDKKLQEITEELQQNNDENIDVTEKASLANTTALAEVRNNLSESFTQIRTSFANLKDAIVGNDLAKAEEAREQKAVLEKIADKETEVNVNVSGDKDDKDDGGSITGIAAGLGVAVASLAIIPGLALGFVAGLKDSFKGLAKILKLDKIFKPVKTSVNGFFSNFITRIKNIGKSLKGLFKGVTGAIKGAFAPITNQLSKVLKPIKSVFKPILASFDEIGKTFKSVKSLFGAGGGGAGVLGKIFNPIKTFVSTVMKAAPRFMKFGTAIGRLAGRLFLPFTIIMGIFDGVKGAIKGAEEQEGFFNKFIGGLGGAISGILKGLIGMPLDLLKNAIAWILGKFGMKDAEAALKGFSFTDLIGNIVKIPTDFLIGIVDNIKGIFQGDGSFIGNLYQSIGEIVTSLITFPITLLQKAVVGIGEFFGFDMSAVSDFDLAGKVKSLLMLPFNAIAGAFDFITNMFSKEGRAENVSAIKDIGSKINNFLKKVVAFLLPKPDPNGAWYSPSNLASKAIPKAIYEYAGIDKETGAEIPEEGAMFTDRFGNLTENVMDFDVSSLSEGAQKAIGKMQDDLQDNLERQAEVNEELFMLENKAELTKGESKKLQKLKKEQKKLQEAEEKAERDIRIAVSREAELTERPEVIKDEFGGVETGIRVDGIAQDVEPGAKRTAFQSADVARAAADADMRKLEEESLEFLQLQEKLDAALAASSREKFDMNTEEGIEAKRQADLEVQYLTEQLQKQDDKMTATADRIALNTKADADYKARIEDVKLISDDGQLVNEAIAKIDNTEQKLSNTEIAANSLQGNVTDTIKPIGNTQGAQMEATISDTEDAKATANTAISQNLAAPTSNTNNVSSSNITFNQSGHIDKTDKLAFT